MKVKTTFYNHSHGEDFDPRLRINYPKNRADQLSYQPTSKLVDTMFKTGQMITASKQAYDFPDGKDDGKSVPLDRMRGIEMPEVSQLMQENEAKITEHSEKMKRATAERRKKEADAKADQSAQQGGAKGTEATTAVKTGSADKSADA